MIDLYTFGTPNGQKVSILLEELGIPYNVKKIDITKGDQKSPGYLKINPNGKIPALVDHDGSAQTVVFETIAMMIYLCEKHGQKHPHFLPASGAARYKVLEWSLFQAAAVGPMLGQFGHFSVMAKEKIPYAIDRFRTEADRLFGVLDGKLAESKHLAGHEYSMADMATWPWINGFIVFYKADFGREKHPHLARWFDEVGARPAVQRGLRIPTKDQV